MPDLDEPREIFDHFDGDQNGVIDREEFAQLCRALDPEFEAAALAVGLDAVDTNRNGHIEFGEFVAWWTER